MKIKHLTSNDHTAGTTEDNGAGGEDEEEDSRGFWGWIVMSEAESSLAESDLDISNGKSLSLSWISRASDVPSAGLGKKEKWRMEFKAQQQQKQQQQQQQQQYIMPLSSFRT